MTIRITFSLVLALILMSVTYTHAENTPGASIEGLDQFKELTGDGTVTMDADFAFEKG